MGTTYDPELALEKAKIAFDKYDDLKAKMAKQYETVENATTESGAKTFIDMGNGWTDLLKSFMKMLDELVGTEGDHPEDTTVNGLVKTAKKLDETMNGGGN